MVFQIQNRYFPSNTYILKKDSNNKCIVIDPGLDSENIHKCILENNLLPIGIICTHGHFDHIASVAYLKKEFGNIPYYLHKADLKIAKSANFYLKLAKIKYWIEYVVPDYIIEDKIEEIEIGGFNFSVFIFPGHSDGSCILKYYDILFTGDIMYKTGLGLNNFPGEKINMLKESIKNVILSFDKDCLVYPGHGDSEYLGKITTKNLELVNFINNLVL
jgi:glyoxylase-like metal-dependent hydrolase (beta-lactamase superfamily II)